MSDAEPSAPTQTPPVPPGPKAGDLLPLYLDAERWPPDAFERMALERLSQWVWFDGAIWGLGHVREGRPGMVIDHAAVHGRDPAIVREYAVLPVADPVTLRFLLQPEALQRVTVAQAYRSPRLKPVRDYLRRHDVAHLMILGMAEDQRGHHAWLTLYRGVDAPAFGPDDGQTLRELLPHWSLAHRLCRRLNGGLLTQGAPAPTPRPAAPRARLTARQREVLGYLALGMGYREVGETMGLAQETVKFHAKLAYHRLGARNRTEAVLAARARGEPGF